MTPTHATTAICTGNPGFMSPTQASSTTPHIGERNWGTKGDAIGGTGGGFENVGKDSENSEAWDDFKGWFDASPAELARSMSDPSTKQGPEAEINPLLFGLIERMQGGATQKASSWADESVLALGLEPEESSKRTATSRLSSERTAETAEPEQARDKRLKTNNEAPPEAPPVPIFFDALAQIDTNTGCVTWSNARFDAILREVGAGNISTGFKQLSDCFVLSLESTPGEYAHTLGIRSTLQRNGQSLLWAMHRTYAESRANNDLDSWILETLAGGRDDSWILEALA